MAEVVLGITVAQLIGLGIQAAGFLYTVVSGFLKERKERQTKARQHLELQDRLATELKEALKEQAQQAGKAASQQEQLQQAAKQAAEQQARLEQQAQELRRAADPKGALAKEAAAREAGTRRAEMDKQLAALNHQCEMHMNSMHQLRKQLEERDRSIDERDRAMQEASRKWEQAVQSMAHTSISQQELLRQRRAMRAKLLPLPEMEPDDWHITVVMGPAGVGKSSFVLDLLVSLGYPELADASTIKSDGTGTHQVTPYLLHNHQVLLLDCVGYAAAGNMGSSEALAADTLLLFMMERGRMEEVHGHTFALAWRLRSEMKLVFVHPMVDKWLQQYKGSRTASQAVGDLLHGTWKELHTKLSPTRTPSQPGLRERVTSCQVRLDPEIQVLLDIVDRSSCGKFARMCAASPWLSTHAFYCKMTDLATKDLRRVRDSVGQLDEEGEAVLAGEVAALHEAVLPPVLSLEEMASKLQLLKAPTSAVSLSQQSLDTLRISDQDSAFKCKHTLQGHSETVMCCGITPDGRTLVSGSYDNTLKVWDLDSAECKHTLQGHSAYVRSCAITPDGRTLVSASRDNTLKVWDLGSGECKHTLQGHSAHVQSCAITPDGRTLVSASWDKTLKVWDLGSGECKHTLQGHSGGVLSCAITPDGHTLVSASEDKTLKVWDLDSGECKYTLQGHSHVVFCCAITPDGCRLVSGSGDQTLKVWDLGSGVCKYTLQGHSGHVRCCAITPDGCRLVSGSTDRTLKVWDLGSGVCKYTLQGHSGDVWCCAITPDGCRLVSGSKDRTLKVWVRKVVLTI